MSGWEFGQGIGWVDGRVCMDGDQKELVGF